MEASSVELLERWRAGDPRAAEDLFDRYTDQLIRLARRELPAGLAARVDAEDVVQSVYRSFWTDAQAGHYVLSRSGDLWRLLAAITVHKVQNQIARHLAGKRSVRREQSLDQSESVFGVPVESLVREPSPSEAAAVVDELEAVLRDLSPGHRRIVEMRLQGHTLETIAEAVERSERLVRRVLEQVKAALEQRYRGFAHA
jgi:RNA polymerase sigma-70 factor (ECF subfamily)